MSGHSTTRDRWLKRKADAINRWAVRLCTLGAYAVGIHRVHQHAYMHAAVWFAVGLGGTWGVVDDAREARRKAEQARQQQLHKLAALFREIAARENRSRPTCDPS
ncbi:MULTISPECIES: hypothetical protein [unclassified Streptomyces]|uniref:hypothetical protein n=1 Tax=unclassified Streptomyces TaxID=2593676 RepID=UPI003D8FF70B